MSAAFGWCVARVGFIIIIFLHCQRQYFDCCGFHNFTVDSMQKYKSWNTLQPSRNPVPTIRSMRIGRMVRKWVWIICFPLEQVVTRLIHSREPKHLLISPHRHQPVRWSMPLWHLCHAQQLQLLWWFEDISTHSLFLFFWNSPRHLAFFSF